MTRPAGEVLVGRARLADPTLPHQIVLRWNVSGGVARVSCNCLPWSHSFGVVAAGNISEVWRLYDEGKHRSHSAPFVPGTRSGREMRYVLGGGG